MPHLRIAKSGSDYCETCMIMKKTMAKIRDKRSFLMQHERKSFEEHCAITHKDFLLYKEPQTVAEESNTVRHYVFNFAEKSLLPRLLWKLRQLHFMTGLKFDIIGFHSRNVGEAYFFGLPERQWPGEKSMNLVISVPFHTLNPSADSR